MKTRLESNGSAREVELASLDLRYQGLRLQEASAEGRLLASISQRGIEILPTDEDDPLADFVVRRLDGDQ